jgi:hypothetical protein
MRAFGSNRSVRPSTHCCCEVDFSALCAVLGCAFAEHAMSDSKSGAVRKGKAPKPKSFGSWTSPITTALISEAAITLSAVTVSSFGGSVYWIEARPAEKGRKVIVRHDLPQSGGGGGKGTTRDVLPAPYNARTAVHEYGGGDFALADDGRIVFANWEDQRVHVIDRDGKIAPITPETKEKRVVRIASAE